MLLEKCRATKTHTYIELVFVSCLMSAVFFITYYNYEWLHSSLKLLACVSKIYAFAVVLLCYKQRRQYENNGGVSSTLLQHLRPTV